MTDFCPVGPVEGGGAFRAEDMHMTSFASRMSIFVMPGVVLLADKGKEEEEEELLRALLVLLEEEI